MNKDYGGYETSYTSYGGGGGGGGGFIPGEGGSQTSPGGRKDYSQDTLRPVTIKQILDAQSTGDDFKIDDSKITQVTIVGQIRNIATAVTNITYKIDDGTGSIEVKQWVDSDAVEQENSPKAKLVESSYCRVWGKLRSFHDRKHIGAQIIRPVEDYNEVSYHLLEATYVHLYSSRGPIATAGTQDGQSTAAPNGQVQQPTGAFSYGGVDLSPYSATAKKVYKYLVEAPQTNEGLHQQAIAAAIGIDTGDVASAGDELLGGASYTQLWTTRLGLYWTRNKNYHFRSMQGG